MSKKTFLREIERYKINADGSEETEKITHKSMKLEEPEFVKLYGRLWCEFNDVSHPYRSLFIALATRMSYCNQDDLANSQIVYVQGSIANDIMRECNWDSKAMLYKGLKALCSMGAIRKVERGVYQVNPTFAGKGNWIYNPKLRNGGIESLVATFNFTDKTITTVAEFADGDVDIENYGYDMPGYNEDGERDGSIDVVHEISAKQDGIELTERSITNHRKS